MHPTLWKSLDYFLDITQDGSHKSKDLTYKVIDYVRTSGNVNLHRSITYIVMDLLLWYKAIMENPPQEPLWETKFEAEGIVRFCKGRFFVVAEKLYQLDSNGKKFDIGDKVRILQSGKNERPFTTPNGEVTEFVRPYQYEMVDKD